MEYAMTNGQMTLNGITREQLILILEEQKRLKNFTFRPLSCKTAIFRSRQREVRRSIAITGLFSSWSDDEGLKEVMEVTKKITPHSHGQECRLASACCCAIRKTSPVSSSDGR
jgi:hypothetical protein